MANKYWLLAAVGPIIVLVAWHLGARSGLFNEALFPSPVDVFHVYLQADMRASLLRDTAPPQVYVDAYHEQIDMFTENCDQTHPFQSEYLEDNSVYCRIVENLAEVRRSDVILVSLMADEATLDAVRERVIRVLGDRVKTHSLINKNYRGSILEFLSPRSGKWPALRQLASDAGIGPEEIAAIGDDTNDVEMIRGAGLGIAMGNATSAVRDAADVVVCSNAREGVIEAIERVLSRL